MSEDTRPIRSLAAGDPIWMLSPVLACESPIEVAFLDALVASCRASRHTAVAWVNERMYPVTEDYGTGMALHIAPQFKAGAYRFDFCLDIRSLAVESSVLIVECDGHDYHERTKEQALRDRKRDREIQCLGAHVFRFTGREIYRDAASCARACVEFLADQIGATS